MNVIQTAANGVVNKDTIFHFTQTGDMVYAEYTGGRIRKGFLVGQNRNNKLDFTYCQLQTDGVMDSGASSCELMRGEDGKIKLVEHFEWKNRPGEKGVNIFSEI